MNRAQHGASAIVAVALICGCQGGPSTTPPIIIAPQKVEVAGVAPPLTLQASPIALVHKGEVSVGMTPEAAFKAFQDLRSGGFESQDLPTDFKEPYAARSWEDGQHGFGVITYNGRVVAAMYQDEKVTLPELQEFARQHCERLPDIEPRLVVGKRVNYWFWDTDKQRLMICGVATTGNDVRLTACMGDDVVLNALGVSYEQAKKVESEVDHTTFVPDRRPRGSAK